ncbi:hypothetical protein D1007_45343 [Hordeum vulgare]|nr:hypothetical protein D1007_45343 [Hordeum vulgare]
MEKRKRVEKEEKNSPTAEILSEILSRVPYRSLCRFKLFPPQTLSVFFCYSQQDVGGEGLLSFLNLSGWGFVRVCGYVEVMPMASSSATATARRWGGHE